jgi:signal transduction histidine kinase
MSSGSLVRCKAIIAAALMLLFACAPARAAPIGMKHDRWSFDDGAPTRINAITQTRDGFLWIGGVDGLTRFDGVKFEPVRAERSVTSRMIISALLSASNGDLWAGLARSGGVVRLRRGRAANMAMPQPSREVIDIAEGPDGAIWVARGGRANDVLARFRGGRWEELGRDWGLPDGHVWQLLFARDGTLWVVLDSGIASLQPGARRFGLLDRRLEGRASLAEDRQGRLWLADSRAVHLLRSVPGQPCSASVYSPAALKPISGSRMIFDSRGRLWGATLSDGLFTLEAPCASNRGAGGAGFAMFGASDGLTSDQTRSVYEDREGNVWVGTELGLDMLRPANVVVEDAIPANSARGYRMAVVSDGSVYIADGYNLYRIRPGDAPRVVLRSAVPLGTICPAGHDSIWIYRRDRLILVRGDRPTEEVLTPPGRAGFGCVVDRQGRLWFSALEQGLYWREAGRWREWGPARRGVPANLGLSPEGRPVVLFRLDAPGLEYAPFMAVFASRHSVGTIESILFGHSRMFVSGLGGLESVADRKLLSATRYPWLGSVNGLVETASGETWTFGDAGIVRMPTGALLRALDRPGTAIPHRIFGHQDGLNSFVQKSQSPQIGVGGDGRIWFLARRNVLRIDPARLRLNELPPPVHIRALSAGPSSFADPRTLRLAPGTSSVRIAYTALSLAVPSRVRFRYKLEGIDAHWVEAGTAREAGYNELDPGEYRFMVMATNNDGVWSKAPAILSFTIPPTFYETWAFRLACLILTLFLGWRLYAMRVHSLSRRLQARLEERAAERERIARELHDTLLQGVQGLILRFQAVTDRLPDEDPAKLGFNKALDRADQLLVEGRDRVRDLRSADSRPLHQAIKDLVAEQPFAPETRVTVRTEGPERPVRPLILDEIVRIAGEALFNAARHATAARVDVQIIFGETRLEISVRDDGQGIPAERLLRAGQEGHFGLVGMHERARKIGAGLTLHSPAGQGTIVSLDIGGDIAYPPGARAVRLPLLDAARQRLQAWAKRMRG